MAKHWLYCIEYNVNGVWCGLPAPYSTAYSTQDEAETAARAFNRPEPFRIMRG